MNMHFGAALLAMTQCHERVRRRGWGVKKMYLWFMPEANVEAEWCREPLLKQIAEENGGTVRCRGSIRMRTEDGSVLTGWSPAQDDLLAEDWEIIMEQHTKTNKSKQPSENSLNEAGVVVSPAGGASATGAHHIMTRPELYKEIDQELRRFELAKVVLAGYAANPAMAQVHEQLAKYAVEQADALLVALRDPQATADPYTTTVTQLSKLVDELSAIERRGSPKAK